ncbi:MAG: dihydroorotase family protein [Candidatus Bathyarchaeia archaeon]
MIADTVLTNTRAYFNKDIVDCNIAIENGKIIKIGKAAHMPNADEKINLKGLLALPGMIDAHVHLRDEEKAYKEDFYTGTAAAAAGGVTTVLDMPNNAPVTMSAAALRNRMRLAERKTLVKIGFYSEFPRNIDEVTSIVAEGAIAFKLFTANQIGGLNINDDQELQSAFRKISELGVPVAVHAEDKATITAVEEKLKSKRSDAAAFLEAHSEQAELKAIQRLLKLTSQIGILLHFCHITTQSSLDTVEDAKKAGRRVTCEVTPHHLLLSNEDFIRCGSSLAVMPPLRSGNHIAALWKGIVTGNVDIIGSDHAPHSWEEKATRNIWNAKVGVPGLETTLPLMLTMVKKNRLTLADLIRLFSEKPAEIFNLKDCGKLAQGKKADLVVVDLNRKCKIDAAKFHSKAKYSPFEGWEVQGIPVKTFVNGLLVMDEGEIVAKPGSGEILRREPL